jgi:hypothetical protein
MATPGELVKVIADTLGEDEATVTQYDRNLLIAGLRSKGGRGRSAAKSTARDAAHVLTSVLGSYRVKDGVDTVRRYLQTQEHHSHWHQHYPDKPGGMGKPNVWENCGIPELAMLPRDHNFIDALTVLITLASEGRLIRELGNFYPYESLRIGFSWPQTHARISMQSFRNKDDHWSVQADYQPNNPPPEWMKDMTKPLPKGDGTVRPQVSRWFETLALPVICIGALLAGKIDEMPKIEQGDCTESR